ncbi:MULTISPECIES: toll/interleukin-1 receptor domain-containing protein [Comamonas]|uniref:toll/interleukin-1 receptor domain-containing protein n=1 Tax=Comamonas TaxID=283 RepID=UPI0009BEC697|nr:MULTISPECIES: toll/interleukin-1 receptor domain-containing protein [Comamonas]QOQ80405.1 toll/interleukin-1 receptor domain-containing protein [Comamonas thiooxydans]
MNSTPTVFISYSHDSEDHRHWVHQLASKLVENGVQTILDQWDVRLGSSLTSFMEKGLSNADRVLVICTDPYNKKSNDGIGGVGYEKTILTAELLMHQSTTKFIPCIRSVSGPLKTPICLSARTYIDLSDDNYFEQKFKELLHEIYGIPLKPKPTLGKNPFLKEEDEQRPSMNGQSSTVFFNTRFGHAFPGVRGIQWFKDPKEAVQRLSLFFQEPFSFKEQNPIWWWRTGDMHIDQFSVLSPEKILLDHQELIIDEIAAVNAGSYYQSFIYIKCKADEPTGIYEHNNIEERVERWGYIREEYAIFNDQIINRAEYDDGAAVINGSVVKLNGKAVLRDRYITPYNLIIAPQGSPINNNKFDSTRVKYLNEMLKGNLSLDKLTGEILQLPKRSN